MKSYWKTTVFNRYGGEMWLYTLIATVDAILAIFSAGDRNSRFFRRPLWHPHDGARHDRGTMWKPEGPPRGRREWGIARALVENLERRASTRASSSGPWRSERRSHALASSAAASVSASSSQLQVWSAWSARHFFLPPPAAGREQSCGWDAQRLCPKVATPCGEVRKNKTKKRKSW